MAGPTDSAAVLLYCPYQVQRGHKYEDSIALIRDRLDFLTADDKQWIPRKTAERVYFTA